MTIIASVWKEIGYRMKPIGDLVAIRTSSIQNKVRGIYTLESTMWGSSPANKNFVLGDVLAIGADCVDVSEGDTILFERLFFIKCEKLKDGTYVGWVKCPNIIGVIEGDAEFAFTGAGSEIFAGGEVGVCSEGAIAC